LRACLTDAHEALWDSDTAKDDAAVFAARDGAHTAHFHYLILDLNYFHKHRPAQLNARRGKSVPQALIYNDVLHISRASHDRYLQNAVRTLAARVLERLKPDEAAIPQPTRLFGRTSQLNQALEALRRSQIVNITGAGGTGKSALLAAIAQSWPADRVFFFTCRPHLNTRLSALLSALASYLHTRGASLLHGQLIADGGGSRDAQLALRLARADLLTLKTPTLLCIDDADLFLARGIESDAHPVRAFLDALGAHAAQVHTGHRALITGSVDITLRNLTRSETGDMLAPGDAQVAEDAFIDGVFRASGGNLRLLAMVNTLRANGEALSTILDRLPASPSLQAWVDAALERLPAEHVALLRTVAIFDRPAPLDAFGAQAPLLEQLAAQGWLDTRQGGIGMADALRAPALEPLSRDERMALHVFAARAYAERGDAASAARHFAHAEHFERALLTLLPHLDETIRHGRVADALDAIRHIPEQRLSSRFAIAHAAVQTRLYRALGDPRGAASAEAGQSLTGVAAQPASALAGVLAIDAMRHRGWAREQTGDLERALQQFITAQASLDKLLAKQVSLFASRASLALRKRELDTARREALRARFVAERLQGIVFDEMGELENARAHFTAALTLAQALDDHASVAFACNSLGVIAGKQSDAAGARGWFARASAGFEAVSDALQAHTVRANETALLTTIGDYSGALDAGARALAFFESISHTHMIAAVATSLADACANLGRHDEALRYTEQVLAQDDAHFAPYAHYTHAEIALARGDGTRANAAIAQGLRLARRNTDAYIEAYLLRLQGRLLRARAEDEQARQALREARALFDRMGLADEADKTRILLDAPSA
jgi:tetratricopeptide (TPR) repeat protein